MSRTDPEAALVARYPEVRAFAALMLTELDANSRKGDKAGWMSADPEALLHDITWHWAKLAMAFRERKHHLGSCRDPQACSDHPRDWLTVEAAIQEHAADVANMSLMFLDRLGLLSPTQGAPDV